MISLKKFLQLAPPTQKRKLWRMACELEIALRQKIPGADLPRKESSSDDTGDLLMQICQSPHWPRIFPEADSQASQLRALILRASCRLEHKDTDFPKTIRAANDLRHALARLIGHEAAEWDLLPPEEFPKTTTNTINTDLTQLPAFSKKPLRLVFCDDIRSPFNIGSLFRTAEAFGLSGIILSPDCPALSHPRLQRSAMGAVNWLPAMVMPFEEAQSRFQLPAFAIELGGTKLHDFAYPVEGIAVLGSEELGVHPEIIARCRESAGVVSIPLSGIKASLNVGVSFGIVAAAWNR